MVQPQEGTSNLNPEILHLFRKDSTCGRAALDQTLATQTLFCLRVSCLSAAFPWVCFAIFSSPFSNPFEKHCFLSPESPHYLKDGAVKMGHSSAPYCCQIYSQKNTEHRASCKQDSTSCSVKSAALPYVSL